MLIKEDDTWICSHTCARRTPSRRRNGNVPFEEDAREILVLLAGGAGAGKRNGFWDISHYFLAYVDCATGALHVNQGRLVYPLSDEQYAAGNVLGRFPEQVIYRVKARKKKSEEVPEGMTASWRNQFLIVEILGEDAACPELEEVLAEYLRPVVLSDEVLGELTLNKELDLFDGDARGEESGSLYLWRSIRAARKPGNKPCKR